MKIRLTALYFLLFFFQIQPADARPARPNQIPNGNVFGCANCHIDPDGGDLVRLLARPLRTVFSLDLG